MNRLSTTGKIALTAVLLLAALVWWLLRNRHQ